MLGEFRIDTDPDCTGKGENKKCAPPKITRNITSEDQIIVHEDYKPGSNNQMNDIALIRLNEPVPLFSEDSKKSWAKPVCLPWKEDDAGRDIYDEDKVTLTGWGRIKTSLKDIERKKKFGASARNLLYIQLPVANDVCDKDEQLKPYWDPETKVCVGGKQGKWNE